MNEQQIVLTVHNQVETGLAFFLLKITRTLKVEGDEANQRIYLPKLTNSYVFFIRNDVNHFGLRTE